jgi:hypothetical protein
MAKESGIPKLSASMFFFIKKSTCPRCWHLFPECPALRPLPNVKHHKKINFYYFSHDIFKWVFAMYHGKRSQILVFEKVCPLSSPFTITKGVLVCQVISIDFE